VKAPDRPPSELTVPATSVLTIFSIAFFPPRAVM
jgi:hypothetical protein